MRLRDLSKIYIYESSKKLKTGEYMTVWTYKDEDWLNDQQDIDELNRNAAGEVDYEIIKLRINRPTKLSKGDGVSFEKLKTDVKGTVLNNKPKYIVENEPKIGKTTLYTLKINQGE